MEEINFSAPSVCDPNHAMVKILRANARALVAAPTAWRPLSLTTDAVMSVMIRSEALADEHVEIEEYLHIVPMHALSEFDYLSA